MTTVAAIRCRSYSQLREALAARRRQLGLTQLAADERAGLQSSYVGKLEIGTRKLGDLSLPMLLAALDCDILLAPRSADTPADRRPDSAAGSGYEAVSRAAMIPQE
jgi:transcriptional regulator with XRE-family HTH domain